MKITYRSERRWFNRILEARKRGEFTKLDIVESASWPTCAVGEIDGNLPRIGPAPVDNHLTFLGVTFSRAVYLNDFDEAAEIQKKITARVLELPEPEPRTEE